jgi:hypothetical protein
MRKLLHMVYCYCILKSEERSDPSKAFGKTAINSEAAALTAGEAGREQLASHSKNTCCLFA